MIDGASRSGSIAVGVLKALRALSADEKSTTLESICDWLSSAEAYYYDDWLIVGGRSAKQYVADILEDLHDLEVVRGVDRQIEGDASAIHGWVIRTREKEEGMG
ncbi:hypothetical protein LBW56_18015 [Ralstonia solanacearum]|uniref:hypothetical protein n=1 Tax=Ralstonia solanacearum TaxID=305 RepID=UPI001FF9765C|nr:hypothetical protein [Ralstonia solanacearum]MDB0528580.1 hypothetical protein [Ralstonia solanacearum]